MHFSFRLFRDENLLVGRLHVPEHQWRVHPASVDVRWQQGLQRWIWWSVMQWVLECVYNIIWQMGLVWENCMRSAKKCNRKFKLSWAAVVKVKLRWGNTTLGGNWIAWKGTPRLQQFRLFMTMFWMEQFRWFLVIRTSDRARWRCNIPLYRLNFQQDVTCWGKVSLLQSSIKFHIKSLICLHISEA